MFLNELIGFIAGSLVSISFLPQVIKSWKSRKVNDLSLSLILINILGQVIWIIYGIRQNSLSIVIMSNFTLLLAAVLMFLKLKYK